MAAAASLLSCTRTELDPIQGIFPDASLITFTQNTKNEYVKDALGRKTFTLEWTDGTNVLKTTMIGAKYYLGTNTYTIAADNLAKNGNFVAEKTSLNGNPVAGGDIIVERLANDQYKINGVLFVDANGTASNIRWEGELKYVRDPLPPVAYYYSLGDLGDVSDSSGNTIEGVKSTVITLADIATGAFFGQLSLNLEEAQAKTQQSSNKVVDGVYDVKEYAHEAFTAGNGFDMTPYVGYQLVIGSYFLDENGNVVTINAGDAIEVYKEDGHTVFETNSGYIFVTDPLPIDPNKWDTVDMGEGVELLGTEVDPLGQTVTVQLATKGLTKPFDRESEGYYLNLVLNSKDGYLHEGSYAAGDGSASTFLIGYDVFEPGIQLNNGSTLWKVSGANAEVRNITEGTVTVNRNDGETPEETTWTILLETEQVVLNFTGAVPALTSDGVLIDDVDPSKLTQSWKINYDAGSKKLSLSFGTDDISYAAATYSYSGVGYHLSLDIYSPDGKLYDGLYHAGTIAGVVNAGEFGIGFDYPDYYIFNWGTCWWTCDKKAAVYETAQKVLDGTVDVMYDAATEEFTITLESTVITTTFIGKIEGVEGVPETDLYDGLKIDKFVSAAANPGKLSFEFNTEGIAQTGADENDGYSPLYSGNGYSLKMDIYSADGTLAPGVYTASATGDTVNAGEFAIGYDTEFWGMQMHNWGTVLFTVVNDVTTAVKVLDGTVTVSKRGDVYTILLESTAVPSARFKGKLSQE